MSKMEQDTNHFADYFSKNQRAEINVLLMIDEKSLHIDPLRLFKKLENFAAKKIILYGTLNFIAAFLHRAQQERKILSQFEFSIIFKPDLYTFLRRNLPKVENFLLPRLFCNTAYFKRHQLLSQDVFHFFGMEPEIFHIQAAEDSILLQITKPQDVDSIFLLKAENQANIYQEVNEITEYLNPANGHLPIELEKGQEYRVVVLRRFFFDPHTELSHIFNYYDATAFAALQKWFKSQMVRLPVPINGVVYPLEEMFDVTQKFNGVSYSANLEKVLRGIKKTIAFYYANAQNTAINNIFLSIVLKRYFNSMLRPRFNIVSPMVHYLIYPDSPLARILDMDHQFLFELDMEQFEPHTPYYWKTVGSLKRAESQLFAENESNLPVLVHYLMQSHFSIPEQKVHIDLLAQAGATKFWWKDLGDDTAVSGANLQFIKNKLIYAVQLGAFLSQGLPVSEILVLYPSLDQNQQPFLKILQELHHSGINFELVDYDLFNSNHHCKLESGKINFNQKSFHLVLLPSIQVIPILTMNKLLKFFKEGGHIAALQKVPSKVELRDKQKRFESIRQKLWLVEPNVQSITFLQSESGGKSLFIPKLKLVQEFLRPYVQNQPVFVQTGQCQLLVRIRETQNAYFAFVTNPDNKFECSAVLQAQKKLLPYRWNFKKQIREPVHYWSFRNEQLKVPVKLLPLESQLLILDKNTTNEKWHVGFCDADHCHIYSPEPEAFVVQLRKAIPGTVILRLERGNQMIKVPLQIRNNFNPIYITPDHWVLSIGTKKQMIHLDDLKKVTIEPESAITLQKTFVLREFRPGQSYILDLGLAPHPCKITLNGQMCGNLWFHPFQIEISHFIKTGENTLEIEFIGPVQTGKESRPAAGYDFKNAIRIIPYQKFYIRAEDYAGRKRKSDGS